MKTTTNIMTLDEFNHLSMTLDIKLTKELKQISPHLYNTAADSSAKIKSVKLCAHIWEDEDYETQRNLSKAELNAIVINEPSINIRSYHGKETMPFDAPDKACFRVKDLLKAIEQYEYKVRPKTEWFGGIDCHHIYFEGLHDEGGVYNIHWGS